MDKKIGKVPPHSLEAEKSVLGAAMISKEALIDILDALIGEDFYNKAHREIFQSIATLHGKNQPVDSLTVSEELKRRNTLEVVGGRTYVMELTEETPSVYNAKEYAQIISEKAILRRLIDTAASISDKSFRQAEDPREVLDFAEKRVFDIAKEKQSNEVAELADILAINLRQIEERSQQKGGVVGVPSGLIDLDKKLSGFKKSDMIVLAARPSMGKTAFSLNVALHAALREKATVLIFSLEMSKEQLGQRLLSMESRIESQKMSSGDITDDDWISLAGAVNSLGEGNILIDDTPGLKMMEIKNKCRRVKNDKGLDLIILDYLQLMVEENIESRQQQVSNLSRGMKLLAREMECPVIVLSQLSRKVEARDNKSPLMSDLRESGAIEQDADVILFLYRDEVYNEDTEKPNICEVIVAKHRNGPIGTVEVGWQSRFTKFVNLQR